MITWWESLSIIEQILATIAIISTLLLGLQFFLSLFSLGGGASMDSTDFEVTMGDVDVGGDFDASHVPTTSYDTGVKLFTLQGIVSFFSVFGWSALALLQGGQSYFVSLMLSFLFGLLAMFSVAMAFRCMSRLRADGTLDLRYAVGKSGTVYLTIPPKRTNTGKVTILLQERVVELDAISDQEESIPTGAQVLVVGVSNQSTLLVKQQ